MTAAVTVIKRALNAIGAHSEVNPADPELLSVGLEQLVTLLGELIEDEVYPGKRLSSLTSAGTTATGTLVDHEIAAGAIIVIAGAEQAGYNGEFEVVAAPTDDTFTYTLEEAQDSPATGDISVIVYPETTGDELNEHRAATTDLQYELARRMAPLCRVELTAGTKMRCDAAYANLRRRFQATTIPSLVPSKLLPRGQGSTRGSQPQTFFNGSELDADSAS